MALELSQPEAVLRGVLDMIAWVQERRGSSAYLLSLLVTPDRTGRLGTAGLAGREGAFLQARQ